MEADTEYRSDDGLTLWHIDLELPTGVEIQYKYLIKNKAENRLKK